ncbi:putative amidoligase enzyme-domain-containing protein [Rostrohypoxylon terebratum]|nr:putative amidoligase enzyme-domain-containing protein [Rostrohypoxylon terebratum]
MPLHYYFGVEIEAIAEPHTVRSPLLRWVYYEKLATALRWDGLEALADREVQYRKHSEHYDKWWITRDGSLKNPPHPQIPLEAVSPIMSTRQRWENEIDMFWASWHRIFHMPIQSNKCGSHVHISPWPEKEFRLDQLKSIAFGIILYEPLIEELLPANRRHNRFCEMNSSYSSRLRVCWDLQTVWIRIRGCDYKWELRRLMQEDKGTREDRYVLWNFDNILEGRSGTVEFRGGRGLRGPVRTKRWIAFVIAFIDMCLGEGYDSWDDFERPSMTMFWSKILWSASRNGIDDSLPSNWRAMPELVRDGILEDVSDTESSDGSVASSTLSKSDDAYCDSDCSECDKEFIIEELEQERREICVIL